ncbi:hypothetical protein SO802_027808 [Lithocarpus litseifolius]|uniref:Uncharacterized protein n=1 Tax=Lithocarpus litseifolius TaxID=425828 RepID=A0AAW2BRM4_9ROSI
MSHSRFVFRWHKYKIHQVNSASCESSERINMLKSESVEASEKNSELRKEIKELTEKLRLADQRKDNAQKQVVVLGKQQKAGPFGTVKGLRTSPAIIPDELSIQDWQRY